MLRLDLDARDVGVDEAAVVNRRRWFEMLPNRLCDQCLPRISTFPWSTTGKSPDSRPPTTPAAAFLKQRRQVEPERAGSSVGPLRKLREGRINLAIIAGLEHFDFQPAQLPAQYQSCSVEPLHFFVLSIK